MKKKIIWGDRYSRTTVNIQLYDFSTLILETDHT